MNPGITLLALFLTPVALAVAAILWGADTRDGVHSREWNRRQGWPA
jgi:hypothetical protein